MRAGRPKSQGTANQATRAIRAIHDQARQGDQSHFMIKPDKAIRAIHCSQLFRGFCICFCRYRRIFWYHFCHLVLRLQPWSLGWPLAPASIFSGFSTRRWIPGLGVKPPKTTQPPTSAELELGRPRKKKPRCSGQGSNPGPHGHRASVV